MKLLQVRLREFGQAFNYPFPHFPLDVDDIVIVEVERGIDYGHIISISQESIPEDSSQVGLEGKKEDFRKVLRKANSQDHKIIEDNKQKIKEASKTCIQKIEEHKLPMKLVEAEYAFDRTKIIFYFTAQGRIDFRRLVKDLADIFKVRIELRQIGVRDEAKLLGGFGPCGRQLCCATFLKDFEPVSIKMAKEQNLPLSPPKISGLCGRLMCCLMYEYHNYKELSKDLPRVGQKIHTPEGKAKVLAINPLKRTVLIELDEGKQKEISYK